MKAIGITGFMWVLFFAAMLSVFCLGGCGGRKTIDIWNGTYVNEGDFLLDKGIAKFSADLEQTDPDTGYTEKAKVELQGYSSETSEVVGLFLQYLTGQFTLIAKETTVDFPTE